jgi:hypothetical protein
MALCKCCVLPQGEECAWAITVQYFQITQPDSTVVQLHLNRPKRGKNNIKISPIFRRGGGRKGRVIYFHLGQKSKDKKEKKKSSNI